ncbi:hypothetical protein [Oxalicibacterium faecigallinarum]|uniref:hypothetical protein n=1 Tax=Oxalicibacterium faecigallinarum TaxID=573741 RepID=UPI00280AF578|nr:hypothetical protein [Oxalicibacterium faecigallinarum]
MVELLIVAGFVLIPLFLAIPLLGKYLDVRSTAVQGARYAAWERTVFYGGDAASSIGWGSFTNKWKANEKTDGAIQAEMRARYFSETGTSSHFSSSDAGASLTQKVLWQDRVGTKLADYQDVSNGIANGKAPGTLNIILEPIADLAATLGPFTLEMKGAYTATVNVNVADIDTNSFLLKSTKTSFVEKNVLLANGWNAGGPDATNLTSVKQQVKGLTPTSIIATEVGGVKIIDYVLGALSLFLPEVSKLEPGKIEPDVVPPDRLK